MITVETAKHGKYEASADMVSGFIVAYAGKGIREMRIDWCEILSQPEWIWQDISERSTWIVMLASRIGAPLLMRR